MTIGRFLNSMVRGAYMAGLATAIACGSAAPAGSAEAGGGDGAARAGAQPAAVAASPRPSDLPNTAGLDTLAQWLTGSFSSQRQAAFHMDYRDIRLEMARIWQGRDDGIWLYVEQAAASALDKPYRQRVYRLAATDDGAFVSEVYTLPEPMKYAGAWKDPARLDAVSPDNLEERTGCAVTMRYESAEGFVGATTGKDCSSTLSGATYATSEVTVRPEGLRSWDRGYDAAGEQVWGAEEGPYMFLRVAG